MTSSADLRRIPFDGGLVFRDQASGRIWLLEGELAEATRELDDDDVIRALASLQEAPEAPAALPGDTFQAPGHAPPLEYRLADGDGAAVVRVRVWDEGMATILRHMLAPLVVAREPTLTHDLSVIGGRTIIARDGIVAEDNQGVGWWLLIRWLSRDLHPGREWLGVLHAATVLPAQGGAVVVAGVSGSGKTTLAGGLIASGARLIADDATPIESRSRLVWPCPLGMGVKRGSWPVFAGLFADFERRAAPSVPYGPREIRYFDAPRAGHGRGYPIAALVFPTWQEGAPLEASRLRPIEALRFLAESGAIPADEAPLLAEMLGWLEDVPVWRVVYGDLAEAVPFVERLAAGAAVP